MPGRIGIWKFWFLRRGENRGTRKKTFPSKGENQQRTQPTYGATARIWTRATLVGGERSQYCTMPCSLQKAKPPPKIGKGCIGEGRNGGGGGGGVGSITSRYSGIEPSLRAEDAWKSLCQSRWPWTNLFPCISATRSLPLATWDWRTFQWTLKNAVWI